jgi:hypothetical protein
MPGDDLVVRDFIYLDYSRVKSLAAQLGVSEHHAGAGAGASAAGPDLAERERMFFALEAAVMGRGAAEIDPSFDFASWTPDAFSDGQFVVARGAVRLLDFSWLALALTGLPAVLKKMSKIEMAALKNSDEGRRLSKTALQQRSQENMAAIAKVEELKMDELSDVVRQLYPGVVRVKVRPSPDQPRHVLIGSAYADHFYDTPAALSQKYGVEVDAGWTVLGQLNVPNPGGAATQAQPIPTGNQMEDAFEQMALLMNNAFRLANAPAFPALSLTPIAIYRTVR